MSDEGRKTFFALAVAKEDPAEPADAFPLALRSVLHRFDLWDVPLRITESSDGFTMYFSKNTV